MCLNWEDINDLSAARAGSSNGTDDPMPGRKEETLDTADSNTVFLVIVLVLGVGLIFICFATVAICYRYRPRATWPHIHVPLSYSTRVSCTTAQVSARCCGYVVHGRSCLSALCATSSRQQKCLDRIAGEYFNWPSPCHPCVVSVTVTAAVHLGSGSGLQFYMH